MFLQQRPGNGSLVFLRFANGGILVSCFMASVGLDIIAPVMMFCFVLDLVEACQVGLCRC